MAKIMAKKEATWESYRQSGYFDGTRYRSSNAFSACLDGYVKMALNETAEISMQKLGRYRPFDPLRPRFH